MSDDLATLVVGPRTYRVRIPNISSTLDVVALEGTIEVARARVTLPSYFDADRATIAPQGDELVVALLAFHCKDDTPFEGTVRLDASCNVLSKSW